MITIEDVERLVQDIWSSVLSDDAIVPVAPSAEHLAGRVFLACVSITGGTNASLQLACAPPVAERIARTMFQLDSGPVGEADLRDALGEIANMVAGNVKAVLPGPSQLGLPVVCEGHDVIARVPASHVEVEVALRWYDDPLVITVLLANEPAPPPSRVVPQSSPWSRR
jgi:chemotaxis protein CheX